MVLVTVEATMAFHSKVYVCLKTSSDSLSSVVYKTIVPTLKGWRLKR